MRFQRQHAVANRIDYLRGVEQVAPHQGSVAFRQELLPRKMNPHCRRLLDRLIAVRWVSPDRQTRFLFRPDNLFLRIARQLPTVAGDVRGPQRAHHLVEFRYEDAVAGDQLKVVRDGAIRRDPALENDIAIVVEEQAAYAGNDRSGLRRQAAAITSPRG